jgi:hypothetical protein
VDEDEEWVATFDETVSSADARSSHFPRKRYIAVTCLHDFKFLSIENVCTRYTNTDGGKHVTYASAREWDGVSLLVFHVPDAILWKIDATWDKEKIYLAVCSNRFRKG